MILYQTSQLWIVLGKTFCKDVFVERFYIIIFVNVCLTTIRQLGPKFMFAINKTLSGLMKSITFCIY